MAEFHYTGKTLENKTVKGKIDARSREDAFHALKAKGVYGYQIDEVGKAKETFTKLKSLELADFSRQIGSMLSAGVSITKAVLILKERAATPRLKSVFEKLYDIITVGNTLSYAMEQCKNTFPVLMINMYKAGELSGGLDKSAMKMAEYYDKENKLNSKVKGAMTYPIILLCLTILVTIIIFTFVLPNFLAIFENMEIPMITRVVLSISKALTSYWYLFLIAAVASVLAVAYLMKQPKVAVGFDKMKVKLPKIGRLLTIIYTARFARTLSSLYGSGINMIDAVAIGSKIIGNRFVEGQFGDVITKIKDGNLLSNSMENIIGIDKKLTSSIYIGEETGKLDEILISMADNYDYEAEAATAKLLTYIEPVMIVIMALIIGTIMMAVMLPIMSLNKSIG